MSHLKITKYTEKTKVLWDFRSKHSLRSFGLTNNGKFALGALGAFELTNKEEFTLGTLGPELGP